MKQTISTNQGPFMPRMLFLGKRTSEIILRGQMVLYYRFRQDFSFFTSNIKLIYGP